MALLERMEPIVDKDPMVPFTMASLYKRLGSNQHEMIRLWRMGYAKLLEMNGNHLDSHSGCMLETIDEEIRSCGLDTHEVLGKDFTYPAVTDTSVGTNLPFCKVYMGPISFGPHGQTLTVMTRNIFHEMKNFRGCRVAEKQRLLRSFASASGRYCKEVQVIEKYLSEFRLNASTEALQEEFEVVMEIGDPSHSPEDVQKKAVRALNELIPKYVENRRSRLLRMYEEVKGKKALPQPLVNADPILKKAFESLEAGECSHDSTHDALMAMAVNHWKPKRVPETLPLIFHHTIARLRDKSLRRLSDAELVLYRHQQGPQDFAVFLIVTALLHKAGEKEAWYF